MYQFIAALTHEITLICCNASDSELFINLLLKYLPIALLCSYYLSNAAYSDKTNAWYVDWNTVLIIGGHGTGLPAIQQSKTVTTSHSSSSTLRCENLSLCGCGVLFFFCHIVLHQGLLPTLM